MLSQEPTVASMTEKDICEAYRDTGLDPMFFGPTGAPVVGALTQQAQRAGASSSGAASSLQTTAPKDLSIRVLLFLNMIRITLYVHSRRKY